MSKDQNEKSILLDVWIFKSIIYGGGVPNIDIKTFRNGINQVSKSTSSVIKVAQLNAPSASCCRPLDTTRLTDGEIVMLIGVEEQFRSEIKKEYNRGLGSDWFKEYISQERPKSFLVSNVSFYVD